MDQLEERILQTDQLKNASKHLQHHVDHTLSIQVGKHPYKILGMFIERLNCLVYIVHLMRSVERFKITLHHSLERYITLALRPKHGIREIINSNK